MAYNGTRKNRKHAGDSVMTAFSITKSLNQTIATVAAQKGISRSLLVTEILQKELEAAA